MTSFGILGPLSVREGDRDLPVTAGRDRVVLAMLLLNAGRMVRVADLVDAVWDDDPPATARGQLQTCISRLRRALPPGTIRTDPTGYGVGAADLDATRFAALVAQARQTSDPERGRHLLRQALDLWRDDALSGLDSRAVRKRAAVLDQQRAAAIEDWVELELAVGRDRDLVAELSGLVAEFPLRERLRSQLMLALYRSGRQADALAEYHRAQALLDRELGVEPGRELQDMHRRLLTGEVPARAHRAGPVNALPRAVGDFTGRGSIVRRILASVDAAGPGPHIEVVEGMAGIGKTTLAVHVAALLRDRYPDAQLFLDLQGHSEKSPVEPAAALATLLRQVGVAGGDVPEDPAERSLLWRTELSQRRAVLILDNAESTAQVTPLLPGGGQVLALVTSRRRLLGMDGVRPEPMEVLADDEAVALLAAIAGDRVAAEPEAAAEVVRRCGGLPLAIRLAGARLAHRPRWRVADLARRLGESLLPELAAEDRTVAGAFAVSYGQLSAPGRRMFRLLGTQPVETFGVLSAAALTGRPADDTQDQLDDLVDVNLIEEPAPGRYRMHDLVREYARSLATPPEERSAALSDLIDFHLHVSATLARRSEQWIDEREVPARPPRRPELVTAALDDDGWFEQQRPYLAGLVTTAAELGEIDPGWLLARVNWHFLYVAGHNDDLVTVMTLGLRVASTAGGHGVAAMSNYLASGYHRLARDAEAEKLLREALDRHVQPGDRLTEARYRGNLSAILGRQGKIAEAYQTLSQSCQIMREVGQPSSVLIRLGDLAYFLMLLGRDAEGLVLARRQIQAAVEQRHPMTLSKALIFTAQARLKLGSVGPAERLARAALRLARQIGYRVGEAEARNELGRVAVVQGRFGDAVTHHLEARQLMQAQGDRRGVTAVSNDLALALSASGDRPGACDVHRRALDLARRSSLVYEEARALSGIAACLDGEDPEAARRHLRQALVIFERMGVPERFDVRRRLEDRLRTGAGRGTMDR